MISLALLGCGNMGSAIALGLAKKSKGFKYFLYTPSQKRAKILAKKIRGKVAKKISDLKSCEYFLIACKPQQFENLAKNLRPILKADSKIISVLAGVSSKRIKKSLGSKKIARAMPNTPCLIGEGACAIYFSGMNAKEKKVVEKIFSPVAKIFRVQNDDEIDAATAIIGSGPAYFFEITRIFAQTISQLGILPKTALDMAKQVAKGASLMMHQSKDSPEVLRNRVTSKKGTTQAALDSFKADHLETILKAGIQSAYKRAKQLGR